jgi:hypothetical protein
MLYIIIMMQILNFSLYKILNFNPDKNNKFPELEAYVTWSQVKIGNLITVTD